ncbi:MAG: glycerol-3-phosphate dehydrogenase [Candidatus Omnitrophica bacterium CG07_land_8_20_14_0_80_42_15]|uniref:Glycerol-3-phosphate dehydrogenase [NAD(P)+] n=1 Tax=Candidatus Aquitaenariimonas noxiae TaxID=1974741 RepID=A0A2J0L2L1_9BACT|nr:MAG: glycerol-3-phosphate dehydrogenase [Candidatus Omnitrophica bacterium CG07_land_8_20_14_0_80_42_15]
MKTAILGDGGWGTTLSILLHRKKHDVALWGAFPDYVEFLKKKRENQKFLPGIKIPKGLKITDSLKEAVEGAEVVILAIPSQYMRGILEKLKPLNVKDAVFVNVAKGIENGTLKRMSEVIVDVLGEVKFATLSGPSIAREVAIGIPTTVVISSYDMALAKEMQEFFRTETLRVYTTNDLIGVELGGSLKNIIAIVAGINDGLGFGANSKASILTRGLVEITRLGVAMGAKKETFSGLSGIGDLVTTCISPYGRNRWFGEEIGKGKKLSEIQKETEMVVEGVATAKSAYELAKKYKVDMPITEQVYNILYHNKNPKEAVVELMSRQQKAE